MLNDLLLLSGVDIPFPAAQVNIHQPTIKEIAYISEESFFIGCELLRFSKNNLSAEDKANLENQTDFDIIMSIMKDKKGIGSQRSAASAMLVLLLMFPDYQIQIRKDHIALMKSVETVFEKDGQRVVKPQIQEFVINNKNYDSFKEILVSMFCLKGQIEKEYNPGGDLAQKIADKLRKGKAKISQDQPPQKISVLSRYASILAVGEQKDLNELMNYTVYQLFDEFQRFEMKMNYEIYIQAKMAGAKDLKEVDNWMKDIHS